MTTIPLPRTSAPAERALATIDVDTLDDLTTHTKTEVASLHGMGPKALSILDNALREHGLSFRD